MRVPVAALVVLVLSAAGCGKLRRSDREPYCPDWEREVGPLAQARCVTCHGEAVAQGGWRADTYVHAMEPRDDGTPRVVVGDVTTSLVTRAVSGALDGHPDPGLSTDEREDLEAWVRCRAPARHFVYHPQGWATPSDAEQFHGKALRRLSYSTATCEGCHGGDLKGGKAEVGCYGCHVKGPADCGTCHGDATTPAPPRAIFGGRTTASVGVGAHRTHLKNGPLHAAYTCDVCHVTPALPRDEGHYQRGGVLDELPAEVVLKTTPGRNAEWEHERATCERSVCHAPSVDAKATKQNPVWTSVGKGEADCGTCHGLPPSTHVDDRCEGCHARVYAQGHLIAPELHANGTVELGDGSGECTNCHGDATSPAPPRDVSGSTDPSRVTIGAHRAHLFADTFRGPIACTECHLVPAKVMDVGHLDTAAPAEVFPAVDGLAPLSRADDARPAFDPGSGTCSNVYCHGGGGRAARDATVGLLRAPVWVGGASQVRCGGCHGLPPKDGLHAQTLTLTQCVTCHFATIGADGKLKFAGGGDGGVPLSSSHLDGVVQLGGPPP